MVTSTIGMSEELSAPFYTGLGTSTEVPGKWDLALNGLTFMLDSRYFGPDGRARRPTIPLLKPQQDGSGEISEASLNPEDLARQSQESWHKGAGQVFFDRAESDSARFRSSKGVDVFSERFRFQMLPDTDKKSSSSATVMATAVAGSRLYRIDGTTVEYTTDITADTPTWTAVTGLPAGAPVSICSDGFNVYIACSANGIYKTDTTTNAAASFTTGTVTLVAWVKGRLMAAGGSSIYNVVVGGGAALPSALNSTLATGITWVRFAEGPNHIYAAGYSGTQSLIYKTTITADGTGLGAPSVATQLPDGETVRTIRGYEGYLFVGTDKGAWICQPDSNGNLTRNKVLETTAAVACFEGQGSYVWFGWTNYDTTSTGLGKLDLSTDLGTRDILTPPYASDLMTTYGTTVQGAVLDVCTFQGVRVFAVSGAGWWAEDTVKVPSACLKTGLITHGLADSKIAIWATIAHEALAGSISVGIAASGSSTFATIGGSTDAGATIATLPAGELRGELFELDFTLTRSSTATTTGPKGIRWVLESNPAPGRGERFLLPLKFYRAVETRTGIETFDVLANYNAVIALVESGRPVTYQDAWGVKTILLDDSEFVTDDYDTDGHQGTFVVAAKRPRRRST